MSLLIPLLRVWSLSARRAWIEMLVSAFTNFRSASLSARRAWIEILALRLADMSAAVALRKESVDRNVLLMALNHPLRRVALRKESVDRNRVSTTIITICIASLSARRAWIEIQIAEKVLKNVLVALRKESVDRNTLLLLTYHQKFVALRKESVDRNGWLLVA